MAATDQTNSVQAVVTALKGPVADVFRRLLPPLRHLSGEEFFTLALANADLLHGCLMIFRRRRDAFAHLLVDDLGRRVNDDFVRLRCGVTLHDIVAMVARTHAKRHFQAALGGDPDDPTSPAGRMYAALKEYLIHEWQVPLVSHYAPLPVDKVLEMGPAVLDLRDKEKLDAISGVLPGEIAAARAVATVTAAREASLPEPPARPAPSPRPAVAPPPPEPAPAFQWSQPPAPPPAPSRPAPRRPAQPARFEGTPQEEFWYQTLEDRQVRATLDLRDEDGIRVLVSALAHLGEPTHSGFLAPLRLSMPQAAVALTVAWRTMGETAFKAVFGVPGDQREIDNLTRRLEAQNIGSRTDLRTLVRAMEANLRIKQLNRARA